MSRAPHPVATRQTKVRIRRSSRAVTPRKIHRTRAKVCAASAALAAELSDLHHAPLVPLHGAAEGVGGADGHRAWAAAAAQRCPLGAHVVNAVACAAETMITGCDAALRAVRAGLPEVQALSAAAGVAVAGAATAFGPRLTGSAVGGTSRSAADVGLATAGAALRRCGAGKTVRDARRRGATTAGAGAAAAGGAEVAKRVDGEARRHTLAGVALPGAALGRTLARALRSAARARATLLRRACASAATTEDHDGVTAPGDRKREGKRHEKRSNTPHGARFYMRPALRPKAPARARANGAPGRRPSGDGRARSEERH